MVNNSGCILDCTTTVPKTYNLNSKYICVEDCFIADANLVTPAFNKECVNSCQLDCNIFEKRKCFIIFFLRRRI